MRALVLQLSVIYQNIKRQILYDIWHFYCPNTNIGLALIHLLPYNLREENYMTLDIFIARDAVLSVKIACNFYTHLRCHV